MSNQNDWAYRKISPLVLARDGYVCAKCGGVADTIDHILPRSLGGGDTPDNLRAMCRRCNSSRGNGTRRSLPYASPSRW